MFLPGAVPLGDDYHHMDDRRGGGSEGGSEVGREGGRAVGKWLGGRGLGGRHGGRWRGGRWNGDRGRGGRKRGGRRHGGIGRRGRGFWGGGSKGGDGSGGYDQGPPEMIIPFGYYAYPCKNEIICKVEIEDVPYYNAPIYLINKMCIGKIDEIFGSPQDYLVSIKLDSGVHIDTLQKNIKLYIDPAKLLPLKRFYPEPGSSGQVLPGSSGRVGERVEGRGRGGPGGKGGRRGWIGGGRGGVGFGRGFGGVVGERLSSFGDEAQDDDGFNN